MAVFLGAGVAALSQRLEGRRLAFAALAMAVIVANQSPLFMGRMIDPFLERPDDVPKYWHDVGHALDAGDRATRALAVPGIDFANYRWGASVDPILPGLTDRAYAARELVPYGSPASADLMNAVDLPFQNGSFDPAGYASILRLLGVGHLVVRNDLQYERYRTPRPKPMTHMIGEVPGLSAPEGFGPTRPNVASSASPLLDDEELAIPTTDPDPHAVEVYGVRQPLRILRTTSEERPVVVAGDGDGIVAAANAGVLDPERLVVYSGSVSGDAAAMRRLLQNDASLVVTDTNRKAGRRWGTTKDNDGYTEMIGETPAADPTDNRLDLFGGRGTDVQTVAEQRGGPIATASHYGNPLSFTPGDRAVHAVDGDPATAWKVGAFADVRGEWLQLDARHLTSPGFITLTQPSAGVNRFITRVRLTFDGGRSGDGRGGAPMTVTLGEASRGAGQRIDLGGRRFRRVRITVEATDRGVLGSYTGLSGVGFTEVRLGDLPPTVEVIRPPVDLLDAAGKAATTAPLTFVFTRRTAAPDTDAPDPEPVLRRLVELPAARDVSAAGMVRLSTTLPPEQLDAMLGVGGLRFSESSRLPGSALTRSSKAFDRSTGTAWQSRHVPVAGEWIQAQAPAPVAVTFDSIALLADGRHSVPTSMHLEVDGVAGPAIRLPAVSDGQPGTVRTVHFEPQTVTGTTFRMVFDSFRTVTSPDWYTHSPDPLPLGVAEIGADALTSLRTTVPAEIDACRTDIATLDGTPLPLRMERTGTASLGAAERGDALAVIPCVGTGPSALVAGEHRMDGLRGAFDVDRLELHSPGALTALRPPTDGPEIRVVGSGPVHYRISLTSEANRPYWLILGQSHNDGWHLTVDGKDLGPPQLVDGYANGWRIDPSRLGATPSFELSWTPQRTVWLALGLSAVGLLLCLLLAMRPPGEVTCRLGAETSPFVVAPLDAFGHPPGRVVTAAVTFGAAVLGALFAGWWARLWSRRGRRAAHRRGLAGTALRHRRCSSAWRPMWW
ncbi:MAG: alpha-(1-_3)-arabinofuranosyltransferase family protein [Microthrixaceae bacterium]